MEYIAHISKDGRTQSVQSHCETVAEKGKIFGEKIKAEHIAKLQGILHDIGKMTIEFCWYIKGNSNLKRGDIDHCYAGARYICELADKTDKNKYDKCARFIARTIISHHGLHDWVKSNGDDYFSERISKDCGYDEIVKAVSQILDEKNLISLLEKANDEYTEIRKKLFGLCKNNIKGNSCQRSAFSFYLGLFERYMQSVLIDADRIDTADFMSDGISDISPDINKLDILWSEMESNLNKKLASFADKNDKISLQRKSISERCKDFADHRCGICRLIVPTGGGKTLSSMRYAIEYSKEFHMDKIIYIAPFMSILEQNSDEIRKLAGEENFLEHHSNILAEIENENELQEYELRTERWDKPVIATTMVQFLNALFSGKNSAVRRMHRLSKAVIIVDEIQSLPIKCTNMFNLAMNFLTQICGAVVVLCSATQPVLDEIDYPLMIDEKNSMTGDFVYDFEVFKRTDVRMCLETHGYSLENAAEFCYEKFSQNGNLLVIVNTKSEALRIYRILKRIEYNEETTVIHLSTNMCPQHRRNKINEIKKLLNEKKPIICVTTQLIEAGIDISFKCVIRFIAGMDNIAQAAGRCNRNGEINHICPVYVINIQNENLSGLSDIKDAQAVSRQIADSSQIEDYLSVDTMSQYYRMLFRKKERELSFNVTDTDNNLPTSIMNLLSLNSVRNIKGIDQYSAQAFKTAGALFNVIDNSTVDVIVPYSEGEDKDAKEILSKLNSDISPNETAELLRKAQKYTVGIYSSSYAKLCEMNALHMLKCGAIELRDGFYNNEYGLSSDEGRQETLIY